MDDFALKHSQEMEAQQGDLPDGAEQTRTRSTRNRSRGKKAIGSASEHSSENRHGQVLSSCQVGMQVDQHWLLSPKLRVAVRQLRVRRAIPKVEGMIWN